MENAAFSPSPSPIELLASRVQQLLPHEGETLQARLGGGIDRLLWTMEAAGYTKLRDAGLDFDLAYTAEGNEVLLVHTTTDSQLGAWGQVWRSEWVFAQVPVSALCKLMENIDRGIEHLAQVARLAARVA